jgi:hypothetical protein
MPLRVIEVNGRRWRVEPSGRRTVYARDEFGLVFTSEDAARERRVVRYSPLGAKSVERALAELSDDELRAYLAQSQPSWTSPELGYRR